MRLSYDRSTDADRDALIVFIAADTYPYNGVPSPTPDDVAGWLAAGRYSEWFWIVLDGMHVGVLHYQDASPIHTEVHLRLHTPYRGRGIGRQALAWLTRYLFETYPQKHRIEGWTRVDNTAMRRVFRACGYVKEAHLRRDFPVGDGTFKDKVGYGILRSDWQHETAMPVDWDDEEKSA